MYFDASQIFGVAGSIVTLAVIAVLIINGGKTAAIITASGNAFANSINTATHPMQAK